jgi:PHP family Zn ribbon phosphoesterase
VRVLHADLHIHTCLSPCAEREMSPLELTRLARERGMDIIGICDHNSVENVTAVTRAAERVGLAVIGGMEITSREEVHLLAFFQNGVGLEAVQNIVYKNLPGENDPDIFGEQIVMDEHDNVIRHNKRLLIGATDLRLDELVRIVHELDGIAIASHVDRPSFSILSQLGFIPENLELDGVEISCEKVPSLPAGLPVIASSDAHRHEEIGSRHTCFFIENGTVSEISMALNQVEGRRILSA